MRLSAPRLAIPAAVIGTAAAAASVAFAVAGPDETAPVTKVGAPSTDDVVVLNAEDVSTASALKYWTPQRMRSAKPVPLPKGVQATSVSGNYTDASTAVAPGGVGPDPVGSTTASGGVSTAAVVNAKQWPANKKNSGIARTTGRLFFSHAGKNYVCSATVVNAPNKHSVWTAAHCLHSGGPKGKVHTKMVFVPRYRDGRAPFGTYTVAKVAIAKQWMNSNNFNFAAGHDLAAFTVRPYKGKQIQARTGAQGINWGYKKRAYPMRLFGYPMVFLPSNKPTQQHRMYYCTGTTRAVRFHKNAPIGMAMQCTMGGGASGGSWLYGMNKNGWGRIVGVNSTHSTVNKYMYSPYHGQLAANIYNRIKKL